jgi:hypothetical protein
MELPNGEQAVIDERKVREYLLSPSHPVGRFKLSSSRASALAPTAGDPSLRPLQDPPRRVTRGSPKRANSAESTRSRGSWKRQAAARGGISQGAMKHELLETVVLVRDVPAHGLRAGDLGAIVEIHFPDNSKMEFVTASGRTTALGTLNESDVRAIADTDLVAVHRSRGQPARQHGAQQPREREGAAGHAACSRSRRARSPRALRVALAIKKRPRTGSVEHVTQLGV